MNAEQEMDMSDWFSPVLMHQIRMASGATIS